MVNISNLRKKENIMQINGITNRQIPASAGCGFLQSKITTES